MNPNQKFRAIDNFNRPLENGTLKTKEGWRKWGEKRLTVNDKRLGFHAVAGVFFRDDVGYYCRINFGAMPV
jgi:hypothetical protein